MSRYSLMMATLVSETPPTSTATTSSRGTTTAPPRVSIQCSRPKFTGRAPVGVTYDGTDVKLYFDGAEESAACADIDRLGLLDARVEEALLRLWYPRRRSFSPADPLETTADAFRLGVWKNDYFTGAIDDLCVYKTALSEQLVQF